MRRGHKPIVTLLTINALRLGALLWVQVAARPLFATPALAQTRQLPNSGAQRERMITLLATMNRSLEETKSLLESGRVKVVVVPETPKKKSTALRR